MIGSNPAGSSTGRAVFRRLTAGRRTWWLRAIVAVLIGGLAFVVSPKPYVARASILLLAPNGANPYLGSSPSLVSTVGILLVKAHESPGMLGTDTKFSADLDDSINEPIIDVTTTDDNAARAQAGLRALEKYLTGSLASIQSAAGVAPSYAIHAQVLTQTPTAQITRYTAIERAILTAPLTFFILVGLGAAVRRRPAADQSPTESAYLSAHHDDAPDIVPAGLR